MNHLLVHSASTMRKVETTPSDIGEVRSVNKPILSGIPCWIGPGSGRTTMSVGKYQVIATHKMLSNGDEDLKAGDIVTDQDGHVYEIVFVQRCSTPSGYHHTECTLTYRSGDGA